MMHKNKMGDRRRQNGSVMVQAVIVLFLLVALLATIAANRHAALEAVQTQLRMRRAEIAARAAMQRALCVLQNTNSSLVTLNDDWALLGDNGNSLFDLGNGTTFRMQMVDTSSLINVNTAATSANGQASPPQLMALPLTQAEIDSLLDWTSTSVEPRIDGAKDSYYNGLQTPYNTKLGPLTTLNELLLISSWVGHDLYSTQNTNQPLSTTGGTLEDTNGNPLALIAMLTVDSGMPSTQASGTARTTVSLRSLEAAGMNAAQATAITQSRAPLTSFQTLLSEPGVTITVAQNLLNTIKFNNTPTRQTGLININTATQSVLQTIPNVTQDMATAIVAQQSTGFQTLGSLTTVAGLNSTRILAQVADKFGIGSDTWLLRVYGESGGVGQAFEILVGIRGTATNPTPQIIAWNRLTNPGIPAWWNWAEQTNSTLDAGDASQTSTSGTGTATTSATPGGSAR